MNEPLLIGFLSLGAMAGLAVIGVPIFVATGVVGVVGLMFDLGISGAFGSNRLSSLLGLGQFWDHLDSALFPDGGFCRSGRHCQRCF